MTGYKFRSPDSNTTSPAFIARWQAHRAAIRPVACDMGNGHVCWVRQPFEAISTTGRSPRCTGCGGAIVPVGTGRLKGFWPEDVAAIVDALERGEA